MYEEGVVKSFGIDINPRKLGRHIEFICKISDIKRSVEEITEK